MKDLQIAMTAADLTSVSTEKTVLLLRQYGAPQMANIQISVYQRKSEMKKVRDGAKVLKVLFRATQQLPFKQPNTQQSNYFDNTPS